MPAEKRDVALVNTFARKLRESREKCGLSMEKMAFAAGSNIRRLRSYEEGKMFPSMQKTRTLARILGVSVDWLLSEDEEDVKEQIQELRKQLEAVWKLVLENCASENATQELLVERGLVTRKELDAREEKYKSDLDIAFVQKAVEALESDAKL